MLILTGAAGFIGSAMAGFLERKGQQEVVLVDDFSPAQKELNWKGRDFQEKIERSQLEGELDRLRGKVTGVIHLGARTDTAELDRELFQRLNVGYSQMVWNFCVEEQVPLVYASSAATYGGGELGFDDDHELVERLQPLNPYGESKNEFDKWVLEQQKTPPFWAGLKFFNVYGPNEYHKGRMASVILHAFRQIRSTGALKLFRSHRQGIADGHQERDFIYVRDVVRVIDWLLENQPASGIYNLGTGQARTFLDLGKSVFRALELPVNISFIDTPADIRDTYQYYTQARMDKLKDAGYPYPFTALEDGVQDYVRHFLLNEAIY